MVEYDADGYPIYSDDGTDKPWQELYNGGYGQGRRWPSQVGAPEDPLDVIYTRQLFSDHLTPGKTLGFPTYDHLENVPEPPAGESNAVYITSVGSQPEGLYQWNGSNYEIIKGRPGPPGPEGPMGPRGEPIDWDRGEMTRSGNGVKKRFFIQHDLGQEPTFVNVAPLTDDASVDHWIESDDSDIIINYSSAPTEGNGNLQWEWAAFGDYISVGDTSTVLSGSGAPAPSLGENGDFYIDVDTYDIYGPKNSGLWGDPTSLVGPTGGISQTELTETVGKVRTFDIQSGGTEEWFKIGTISSGSRFDAGLILDITTNGPYSGPPCHTRVYINGRAENGNTYDYEWTQYGESTDIRGDVVVTRDGDEHYLYIRSNSFLRSDVIVRYSIIGAFDFQSGLIETDTIGSIVYDTGNSSPNAPAKYGNLYSNGSQVLTESSDIDAPQYSPVSIASDYTAADRDAILADASSSALTVTLPSAESGLKISIKKIDSTNDVTVATTGSASIDGLSEDTLISQYESIEVLSDGTNWFII